MVIPKGLLFSLFSPNGPSCRNFLKHRVFTIVAYVVLIIMAVASGLLEFYHTFLGDTKARAPDGSTSLTKT
jgi:hypothetical protein